MAIVLALALATTSDNMNLKFISSGVAKKRGYMPVRAGMTDKEGGIKKGFIKAEAKRQGLLKGNDDVQVWQPV